MNLKEVQIQRKFLYRRTCIVGTERAQQCTIVVTFAVGLEDYLGVCQAVGWSPFQCMQSTC